MKLFCKRWKSELSKRKPENLTLARAIACNETVVNQWFLMLEKWLVELEITCRPEQIYNADESGFNTDPVAVNKVFCRCGAKNLVRIIGGSGKECCTVLECCNAMGDFIPPYILKISTQNGVSMVQQMLVSMLLRVDGWKSMPFMHGFAIL